MRLCVLVFSCYLLSGCDMAEYQRRMDLHRARMKRFDEENKILGAVLKNPTVTDKDVEVPAWPFDVFLRLPKEFSGSIAGEKEHGMIQFNNSRVFRIPGNIEGQSVFLAAGWVGETTKEKSKGEDSGSPRLAEAVFRFQVVATLHEYFRNVHLGNMKFPDSDFKTMVRKNIDVPALGTEKPSSIAVDRYVWEGTPGGKDATPLAFILYHHVAGDKQIAVVFQIPASKKDNADEVKKMEMCLRTLALGDAAAVRRADHARLHR